MKLTTALLSTYLASALELKLGGEFETAPQPCSRSIISHETWTLIDEFYYYSLFAGPPYGVSDEVLNNLFVGGPEG